MASGLANLFYRVRKLLAVRRGERLREVGRDRARELLAAPRRAAAVDEERVASDGVGDGGTVYVDEAYIGNLGEGTGDG